jgi:hypothetical protein
MLDFRLAGSALELEPDVLRLFGATDIGVQGMVSGWSGPEIGHSWNDGAEAVYAIATQAPVGRMLLSIVGEPYVTRVRPLQEITVYGNGYRIHSRRLLARVETVLDFVLESEWWFQRGRMCRMQLHFHLPNSVRPLDIADGPDGRELGFCFRSIGLRTLPD